MSSFYPSYPPALSSATTISLAPPLFNSPRRNNIPRVSCVASNGEKTPSPENFVDRRNILVGLSGLYGASTLNPDSLAFASPVITPPLNKCGPADLPDGAKPTDCCPPATVTIRDYRPTQPAKLRVRPAAHLLDEKYLEKYKRAVELMKSLPEDDPRSFIQQANIHCAYCNGGYDQLGFPVDLQVHGSWLFFPFHRFYLYFHEKIMGELIGDPTFGLPFWNYDAPDGMRMPAIFADEKSPLYSELRNDAHLPPTLVDLDYNGSEPTLEGKALIKNNLGVMYRQVVSGSRTPLLFFGQPYRGGVAPSPGAGSVENTPHAPIHRWCGDPDQPNGENMGNFYSAGRDPIFYSHHSNVDRIWSIWKTLPGKKRKDIQDPDYLNTSFVFYNEKGEAVRVYVRDSLNTKTLGYTFQSNIEIPWINARPTPRRASKIRNQNPFIGAALAQPGSSRPGRAVFPLVLDKIVRTEVTRPRKSRSKSEKEEEEEILVIDGIEFDSNTAVKFDVYINDEDDAEIRADNTEFAGSFVNVPHLGGKNKINKTCFRMGITELLEDLDADGDDTLVVTLVPKLGFDNKVPLLIGDVKIDLEA